MNKRINLVIGSGVLGAYLSAELIKKKEKVVVTTRSLKKIYTNYKYLKIQKKVKFEKLNINKKIEISKIISKYSPKKIFYFAGQSSITKSIKSKQETFSSHYNGTKNFLEILKKEKLKTKFFKANSGYIFAPKNGLIDLKCKFSTNKNPYIKAQKKVFNLIKRFRKYKLNLSNLVFMQIESPLRPDDFFIKKVCLGSKNKKKIVVGNLNNYRDYTWITDVVKAILLSSNLITKDRIISAGSKLSGKNIIEEAYKLNGLNYKKYHSINKKFFRKNENKFLIGSKKNISYLKNKYNFKFKIFGNELIKKMYESL
jgi:GDPmannose 4,6-dehydratase